MIHQHQETPYHKGLTVNHINHARNEQTHFPKGHHQQNHAIILTAASTKASSSTRICVTCGIILEEAINVFRVREQKLCFFAFHIDKILSYDHHQGRRKSHWARKPIKLHCPDMSMLEKILFV